MSLPSTFLSISEYGYSGDSSQADLKNTSLVLLGTSENQVVLNHLNSIHSDLKESDITHR